jgi:hypothetical protein
MIFQVNHHCLSNEFQKLKNVWGENMEIGYKKFGRRSLRKGFGGVEQIAARRPGLILFNRSPDELLGAWQNGK